MASSMYLEVRQATSTAQISTDSIWRHVSGFIWNPTTLQTTCLRSGKWLLTFNFILNRARVTKHIYAHCLMLKCQSMRRYAKLPSKFVSYRYRHEIAHDGQRIYILGGGTSWTSYPLDKVQMFPWITILVSVTWLHLFTGTNGPC